jgi:glycosyltransferase involved in cell wall biosynthesis
MTAVQVTHQLASAQLKTSFHLRVVSQKNSRAAVARNNRSLEAAGRMIVLMDYDLVPLNSMIESHLNVLSGDEKSVILAKLMP